MGFDSLLPHFPNLVEGRRLSHFHLSRGSLLRLLHILLIGGTVVALTLDGALRLLLELKHARHQHILLSLLAVLARCLPPCSVLLVRHSLVMIVART